MVNSSPIINSHRQYFKPVEVDSSGKYTSMLWATNKYTKEHYQRDFNIGTTDGISFYNIEQKNLSLQYKWNT